MFCSFCGKEIDDKAQVCIHCKNKVISYNAPIKDEGGALNFWIGFFLPIVGFLIWIFTHDNTPKKAKKALKGAIWGTVIGVLAVILIYVLFFFLMYLGISQFIV